MSQDSNSSSDSEYQDVPINPEDYDSDDTIGVPVVPEESSSSDDEEASETSSTESIQEEDEENDDSDNNQCFNCDVLIDPEDMWYCGNVGCHTVYCDACRRANPEITRIVGCAEEYEEGEDPKDVCEECFNRMDKKEKYCPYRNCSCGNQQ